jgi:hypothetical protein
MQETFNCTILNEKFNVEGPSKIHLDKKRYQLIQSPKCFGEMNPFYGLKHTEEAKEKIRKKIIEKCKDKNFVDSRVNLGIKNGMFGSKRSGELNPMYGKKQNAETKLKISEKAKERYKNGFIPVNKGKKLSQEQKNKIAEKNSKKFKFNNPSGQVINIFNLSKFCREYDLNPIMMSRVSKGTCKNHKGYTKA